MKLKAFLPIWKTLVKRTPPNNSAHSEENIYFNYFYKKICAVATWPPRELESLFKTIYIV